ncbi:MAG: stage V sporulation protein AE [Lachnospiraceae bacterium]|nr:stage V sporulation protein AE [Lachnospiraceae bacterium]
MDYVNAFWVGGLICVVGQILIDKTKLTPARILTTYVVLGVILGAVGWYEPIVEFAGAGASVPLSGFGYTISKGIKEAVHLSGALGIFTGAVTAAAAGITAALIFSFAAALITRSSDKS